MTTVDSHMVQTASSVCPIKSQLIQMNMPRLHRLDLAPNRIGPNRGEKSSVDAQDHIRLPGENLLG
jgi:hypothetical protein